MPTGDSWWRIDAGPSGRCAAGVVLSMLACATLVIFRLSDLTAAAAVSKCVASAGFLVVAALAGALRGTAGRLAFAGLSFSALGDVLLIADGGQLFLYGLVAFLVAHLLYTAAFLAHGVDRRRMVIAAVPLGVLSLAVSIWLTPFVDGSLQLPVRAYTVVITVMVISAAGLAGGATNRLVPLGAILFYLSDLAVAVDRFVQPGFPNYAWGLPLYYGGQLLIAVGTAKLGPGREKSAA